MRKMIFSLLICLSVELSPALAVEYFLATEGNDEWTGQLSAANEDRSDGPFATWERAQRAVRDELARSKSEGGPITVQVRAGTYEIRETIVLDLVATQQRPVLIRNYPNELVRITGGRRLSHFQRVTDPDVREKLTPSARDQVLQVDLKSQGLSDYGVVKTGGAKLYFDDQPMTLARWPNDDFTRIREITDESPHESHGRKGSRVGKFHYETDRPDRWVGEKDIWLHGYWFWDWADSYEKVESVDPQENLITLAKPDHNYGFLKGQRYYALNVLAELDTPGEWRLDREKGRLYFWPPAPLESSAAYLSTLKTAVHFQSAEWVTLQGILVDMTRSTAVRVTGGSHNSIVGCTLRNLGANAISIQGGDHHTVLGCDLYQLDAGGISLVGGDRLSLTPAGHLAENNHIHHYGQRKRTYTPAVGVGGVGNRVRHNLFHDGPHNAVQLGGNEHLVEYNHFHHVCLETDDVGAFYMGRDWTARGNQIRYNYFHHLGHEGKGVGVMAIYLDDWASGATIFGNLCVQAGRAVLIGGGRDNRVENNVFIDCEPAVHIDSRGLGWAKNYFNGETTTLTDRLEAMNYRQPPFSDRYPKLLTLYDDEPAIAKGNQILRNISVGGRWLDLHNGLTDKVVTLQKNLVDVDPHFVDSRHGKYALRSDSPALQLGFQPLPIDKMGLYQDENRASPVEK
ncbi:MAG: right-handed parallel beta-helix repeat-containing protein [Planctomycetes bacterium]|nr:right-handed parallel beta-helix repeat-containing protein [Planctomycetota bacterium]